MIAWAGNRGSDGGYTTTSTMIDYRDCTDTSTHCFNSDSGCVVFYVAVSEPPVFIQLPKPCFNRQNKSPPAVVPCGETIRQREAPEPQGVVALVWIGNFLK